MGSINSYEANDQYWCYTCVRDFVSFSAITAHCNAKNHRQAWTCPHCNHDQLYENKRQLDEHQKKSHFPCSSCGLVFTTSDGKTGHETIMHPFCKLCNRSFVNATGRQQHIGSIHKQCGRCEDYFPNADGLAAHIAEVHTFFCAAGCERRFQATDAKIAHERSFDHKLPCKILGCHAIFKNKKNLKAHSADRHKHRCVPCGLAFPDGFEATKHSMEKHTTYQCKWCSEICKGEEGRMAHDEEFHDFGCTNPGCGFSCPTETVLKNHLERAHGFKCKSCSRGFATEAVREEHYSTMHAVNCTACTLSFPNMNAKDNHFTSFHGVKCTVCSEPFATEALRDAHFNCEHKFLCTSCNFSFLTSVLRDQHAQDFHNHQCGSCNRSFPSLVTRNNHFRAIHGACEDCTLRFFTAEELGNHKSTEHQFQCPSCNSKLKSKEERETHDCGGRRFPCFHCHKLFPTELKRDEHEAEKHQFECGKCGQPFIFEKGLEMHLSKDHKSEPIREVTPLNDKKTILKTEDESIHRAISTPEANATDGECPSRGEVHSNDDDLVNHNVTPGVSRNSELVVECPSEENLARHLDEDPTPRFRCQPCRAFFILEEDLAKHIDKFHRQPSQEQLRKLFRCKDCPALFEAQSESEDHERSCNKDLEYCCDACPAQFHDKSALEAHTADHKAKKAGLAIFYCDLCPGQFLDKSELDKHQLIPHEAFVCVRCSAHFMSISELRNHEIRSNQLGCKGSFRGCNLCGGVFLSEKQFIEHEKLHAKLLPCHECRDQFPTEADMNKHKLDDHAKYPCELCGARFSLDAQLQKHKEIDNCDGTSPHPAAVTPTILCEDCDNLCALATQEDLEKHRTKQHQNCCPYCSAIVDDTELALLGHFIKDHIYNCTNCEAAFPSMDSREAHEARYHGDTVLGGQRCNLCPYGGVFLNQEECQRHVQDHHPALVGNDVEMLLVDYRD